eukprot:gene15216-15360_t
MTSGADRVSITTARYIDHLSGLFKIAFRRWRRRILFVAGGLTVGAAAITMAFLADHAQSAFKQFSAAFPVLGFAATPLGFAFSVWLTQKFFPNSQGSGIPQVIAARHIQDRGQQERLVSLRVALGKITIMSLGLLFGASTGREGPTVQVGASIMYALRKLSPSREPGLLLAGAAAGVAAAFNTPLAGIVFGIEEMSRSFEVRTSGLIIATVISAGLTSMAFVGDYAYFGSTSDVLNLGRAWLVIPVCAVIGGITGGIFSRILVAFANGLPGQIGLAIKSRPIAFAFLCGLTVALCGVIGHGSVFGTGYEEARGIIHGGGPNNLAFGPLKFIATVFSALSGIPGGIFAPSLAIGAGLGSDLSLIFQSIPIGALALIGMVSYLTGVVQAPITAFVIVLEMTNDHAMAFPLMAAALIANWTSKLIMREGLYHALAKRYLPQH